MIIASHVHPDSRSRLKVSFSLTGGTGGEQVGPANLCRAILRLCDFSLNGRCEDKTVRSSLQIVRGASPLCGMAVKLCGSDLPAQSERSIVRVGLPIRRGETPFAQLDGPIVRGERFPHKEMARLCEVGSPTLPERCTQAQRTGAR
jgi:hypothetical protein